jgi:hypothetical protein
MNDYDECLLNCEWCIEGGEYNCIEGGEYVIVFDDKAKEHFICMSCFEMLLKEQKSDYDEKSYLRYFSIKDSNKKDYLFDLKENKLLYPCDVNFLLKRFEWIKESKVNEVSALDLQN